MYIIKKIKNKKQTTTLSMTIDALRFPLALMIILLHNNPLGIQVALHNNNMDLYYLYPVYYTIQHLFTNDITRIAVPLFFFISGYLFFLKLSESPPHHHYSRKMKGLMKRIVVPYFLWNVIYILFNFMIQTFFASFIQGDQKLYADYSWSDWLHFIWYPAGGHLWFLRDLFVVSVCSLPLFFVLRNKILGLCTVLLLGVVWFLDAPKVFGLITVESFFFWSVGTYVCLSKIDFSDSQKLVLPVVLIYTYVLVVEMLLWHYDISSFIYFERLGICIGLLLALAITAKFLTKHNLQTNPLLPKSSFFIYLSHGIVLLLFCRAFTMFVPTSELSLILEYFIVPPVVAALLFWIYRLMSKYTPSFLKLLNGGRV